ncbi:TetR/AcrR family transcriptional regulator [Pantoea sp. BAV 3049]|uniref:TetR/AcrR family transcriptional regulator n=1 Tax=Pantoea sp. BAV 3049 TaxID=2654188 RepID=UPI00131B83E6|nr:TetR/AcrR family transcriptional regulator [Pantoea sp. BAV 3049]
MTALKEHFDPEPDKKPVRKPGRPRGGAINAEQREHLLDIALHLFARQGIAETSLNAIARQAAVSPAMLNYYFRSREALLDSVIEERFAPLRGRIFEAFVANADDPVTAISLLVTEIAETAQKNSWFAPLWMQEAASDEALLKQRLHERYGKEERKKVLSIIEGWQQAGRLNPDLSPQLLMVSLMSLVLVPLARLGKNADRIEREMIVKHALALLCQGISVDKD